MTPNCQRHLSWKTFDWQRSQSTAPYAHHRSWGECDHQKSIPSRFPFDPIQTFAKHKQHTQSSAFSRKSSPTITQACTCVVVVCRTNGKRTIARWKRHPVIPSECQSADSWWKTSSNGGCCVTQIHVHFFCVAFAKWIQRVKEENRRRNETRKKWPIGLKCLR